MSMLPINEAQPDQQALAKQGRQRTQVDLRKTQTNFIH